MTTNPTALAGSIARSRLSPARCSASDAPRAPKGWRRLRLNEKQTVLDWYWSSISREWRKNTRGCLVYPITEWMPHIRRVTSCVKTPNDGTQP